ncbi:acetyl-CoA carboxylase biotin carboxylase subunit [bacterium AH-315-I20]|nr:acetyl-CoA carboxylase biotin carboxylase subunit [bacterium AH-315-I20]
MFHKILVANRGEIAVRIIRACKELGIETVAVYSEADKDAMHTRLADESVCIGPAVSTHSYLNIPSIMAAAALTDTAAIHPGYGFLAENAEFAEIVIESGYTWIGPTPESMRIMGDKVKAKQRMTEAGVPLVYGSPGAVHTVEEAKEVAKDCGFPLIIKAASGGGGRGMKIVHAEPSLPSAFALCKSEAGTVFGDDTVFIEQFLEEPRHIEVQVLGDGHGNIVHLFERECSMQRNNQKVLEEAPSPSISEKTRQEICAAGVAAASAVNYEGAGTIEFLLNPDQSFYFMEMNTRIQVEHPVTEWITGVDLIEWQIRVANGEKLAFKQEDIKMKGHAIECRINAEHPFKFTPSPGKIELYHAPGGRSVRVDSAVYTGYSIPPHYDSMIAKVITHARDRQKCIRRMQRAIDELAIIGITTNQELHKRLLANPGFQAADFNIHFLERWLKQMID